MSSLTVQAAELPWRYPDPFTKSWHIGSDDIDHYQHVNNVAYVRQAEATAWAHSNALGLHFDDYKQLDRGMVIKRHELDYCLAAHENDELLCGTWITEYDGRLSLKRQFQFICTRRKKTVFEAQTTFVCVSLSTGMPKRMPDLFKSVYGEARLFKE